MSDKTYDTLRLAFNSLLPLITACVAAICAAWGFERGDAIIATVAAITAAGNSFLIYLSKQYKISKGGHLDDEGDDVIEDTVNSSEQN